MAPAQNVGDYRSVTSGDPSVAATWETWDGSAWVAATSAPSASNDVYIQSGDTITLSASSVTVKNLYIASGGVLTSTNNNRSITISGGLIQCDGTIFCDGSAYRPMLQWSGTNCVLQGSGTVTLYRVRPASGGAGYSFTFDMNATILNGGVYSNNVANVTFVVDTGRTLTLNNSYFGGASSKTGNVTSAFGIDVYGTVNVTNTSAINLNNSALSTLNVYGNVVFDNTTTFAVTTGTPSINVTGSLTFNGSATFSKMLAQVITGSGSVAFGKTATLTLWGYREGLNSSDGPIRTASVTFDPEMTFIYRGADTLFTGSVLPLTIGKLIIEDTSSVVVLSQNVVITDSLIFRSGKIATGDYRLTLGDTAEVANAGAKSFVEGNVAVTIAAPGVATWPIGIDSTYLPAQLFVSAVEKGGVIGATIKDAILSPLPLPMNPSVSAAKTYFAVQVLEELNIRPDSLLISFKPWEVAGIAPESLQVIDLNEERTKWQNPIINRVDIATGTIVMSGERLSPSEYVVIGPAPLLNVAMREDYNTGTNFGKVALGSSHTETIQIFNTGNQVAQLDSIVCQSLEFSPTVPTMPALIQPAETLFVPMTFTPKGLGVRSAPTILYSSNALSTVDSGVVTGVGEFGVITKIRDARALPNGTVVTIQGTVTRAKGAYTFLQDTTAGIVIYGRTGAFADSVTSGYIQPPAVLTLAGKLAEYNGLREIYITDILGWQKENVIGISPLPITTTLADIAANGEQYESMLVYVPNLTISTSDQTFVAKKTYNISDPTDQSNAVTLRIGDARDTDVDGQPVPTSQFVFVGVLGQYTSTGGGGYQLLPILPSDISIQVDVEKEEATIPATFVAYPAYPNPFNPSTAIKYGLPARSTVTVKVYSLLGQEVATLFNGIQAEGYHTLQWNATGAASGIYFVRMSAQRLDGTGENFHHIMKLVLMK